jgi:predicted nucleic acid-binding protein
MSLGDAIVAGTAITYDRTLATHNTDDFRWIEEIKVLDPLPEHD